MPRRPELSWEMKKAIIDLAAKQGQDNLSVIQRDLDNLIWKEESLQAESTPDFRTIKRVIKGFQMLDQELVVREFAPYVWKMRHDFEEIEARLKSEERAAEKGLDQARLIIRFDPGRRTDLGSYRDDEGRRGFYCTADVWCDGPAAGHRCHGFFMICSPEAMLAKLPRALKLHWAGTAFGKEDQIAEVVDIPRGGSHRLDILFAPLPEHYAGSDTTSGVVVSITVGPDTGFLAEGASTSQMIVEGCLIATPPALRNPDMSNQAYLPPGRYTGLAWVTCDNLLGEMPTLLLEIISPRVGEQLVVRPLPQDEPWRAPCL